jgi:hypothetical protein
MNLENLKFEMINLKFDMILLPVIHPGGQVLENPGPERSGEGIYSESGHCKTMGFQALTITKNLMFEICNNKSEMNKPQGKITIDGSILASGTYLVCLQSNNQILDSVKLIKK